MSLIACPRAGLVAVSFLLATSWAYAYEVVSVSEGGRVEGKVVFTGRVPIKTVIPTKDADVCGGLRKEPEIRVSEDKGVEDAIVYLKGIERGKDWGEPDKVPVIDNKECRFVPSVQIVRAGEIEIHNSDPVLHNTHGFYGRRTAFNVALPNEGDKVVRDLPRTGMVRVECDAHGWMLAHVFVAETPYYALTDSNGNFTIADVPPGDYTLVATHHFTGGTEVPVSVKAGDSLSQTVELKK